MAKVARNVFLALVGLFLAAPIVILVGVSVNEKQRLLFPPQGFSLHWYVQMVADPDWRTAIEHSLIIASSAGLIAVSIALPLAYVFWRHRSTYVKGLYGLGITPFMLPPVVSAVGFMLFWTVAHHYGRIENVIIAHGIFLVTLPLMTVSLGLQAMDEEIVEAARTMGSGEWAVFRTIVLPWIRPYMVSGFAFAFVISINEYIIAYMVAGFTVVTVPIKIFNALRYGYTPVMASISVAFVVLAVIIFGLIGKFGNLPRLLGRWSADDT